MTPLDSKKAQEAAELFVNDKIGTPPEYGWSPIEVKEYEAFLAGAEWQIEQPNQCHCQNIKGGVPLQTLPKKP